MDAEMGEMCFEEAGWATSPGMQTGQSLEADKGQEKILPSEPTEGRSPDHTLTLAQ